MFHSRYIEKLGPMGVQRVAIGVIYAGLSLANFSLLFSLRLYEGKAHFNELFLLMGSSHPAIWVPPPFPSLSLTAFQ